MTEKKKVTKELTTLLIYKWEFLQLKLSKHSGAPECYCISFFYFTVNYKYTHQSIHVVP